MGENNLGSQERALNAKNHKPTCTCAICRRIQAAASAGKPPKSVVRALAHQRRLQRDAARKAVAIKTRRERRINKDAALTSALVSQVAMGERPNIALAARIAGMDPSQAAKKLKNDESINEGIRDALSRIRLDADSLARALDEGLDAFIVKTASLDGKITDERFYPDYATRHKYVETLLKVRGELKLDDAPPQGGLVLIGIKEAQTITPGHEPQCDCDLCIAGWEKRMQRSIKLSTRRAEALEAELLSEQEAKDGVAARYMAGKAATDALEGPDPSDSYQDDDDDEP